MHQANLNAGYKSNNVNYCVYTKELPRWPELLIIIFTLMFEVHVLVTIGDACLYLKCTSL